MSFKECRMLFRSKEGVEIFPIPTKHEDGIDKMEERNFLMKGPTTFQQFAPDGSCVFIHQPKTGVVMCPLDDQDGSEIKSPFLADSKSIQMMCCSPKGTYLLTWERLSSTDPNQPNLKIWDAKTGTFLHGFIQKNLRRVNWPYVQWSHDEKYAFLLVTNEIRVYDGKDFRSENVRFIDKMRISGVISMSVPKKSDVSSYLIASFCPSTKDKPACSSLHKYPCVVPPKASSYPSIVRKSLFQAEEITVHWSPKGDAALMALQTSVDTSGDSYYGSTTLHLMREEYNDVITVPLPRNSSGPILDVAWMPNPAKPSCFAVLSGRMPAMASLHHGTTGEPIFLCGNAHRNTICWANHGRFFCLAGFGNLAGGMTFWDRNKEKVIPQYNSTTGVAVFPEVVASCTVGYGWSPDSRCFGVSTTSPRMNVDNQVRLFSYTGEELKNVPWNNTHYKPDRLLQASFVPSAKNVYPDRPQSPGPRITGTEEEIAEAKRRAKEAAIKPVASAVKRYVPPSARSRSGAGNSLAERIRQEKEGNMMGATKILSKPGIHGASASKIKGMPVGMAPPPVETKSKNALRKERQKRNKAKKGEEEAEADTIVQVDPEKRARKLKKALKQIEDLKIKNLVELNGDQKKKLISEKALREELAQLGLALKSS